MEPYIKDNVSDITYISELILDIFDVKDLIPTYNLCRSTNSISCVVIKRREQWLKKNLSEQSRM